MYRSTMNISLYMNNFSACFYHKSAAQQEVKIKQEIGYFISFTNYKITASYSFTSSSCVGSNVCI